MRPQHLLLALPLLLAGCLDDDTDRRGYRGHSDGGYRSGPVYSDRDWNSERDRTYDRQRGSRSSSDYDRGRSPSVDDLQRACQQGNRNACVGLNREIERRGGNSNSNTGQAPWDNRNGGSLNQR